MNTEKNLNLTGNDLMTRILHISAELQIVCRQVAIQLDAMSESPTTIAAPLSPLTADEVRNRALEHMAISDTTRQAVKDKLDGRRVVEMSQDDLIAFSNWLDEVTE